MSPTATVASPVDSRDINAVPANKGPALVIGSLATAQDGKYQTLISQLETSRHVDRLLVDRLVDGGMWNAIRKLQ
jgi:anamorsin